MSEEVPLPKVDSPIAPAPYVEDEISLELPKIDPKFSPAMLSSQKEKFVHYIVSGLSVGAAAVAVGVAAQTGRVWADQPLIKQAIDHFREKNRDRLGFSMDEAHRMYLDVYRLAEAKEDPVAMKNVVDSLVKLHGIAAAPKPQEVNVNITNPKQVARLSDEKLLEQAGLSPDYLQPVPRQRKPDPEVIEAQYEEVKT